MPRFSKTLNKIVRGDVVTPLASAARQADGDSGWLSCEDFAALALTLNVTAMAGTSPTIDVTVATASDDAGTGAATITTFAQITAPGSARKVITGLDRFYKVAYVLEDTGGDPAVAATATLTSDNTNVANGDTVTIGAVTYTFKTALTDGVVANEVLIGANADASLLNLIRAINRTGTAGTDYGSATVIHPTVSAAASVTSHAFVLTAKTAGLAGNSLASTETSAHLSFGGATFASGEDALSVTFSVSGDAK